jgi:2-polyprenyl-3-methyl-5-hydroxy-6-metoxy-1,4-benzoquinol methylase
MFKQYGKPSTALLMQKKSFFEENNKHINKQKEISDIYISQPLRKLCKNCDTNMSEKIDFIKDSISYKICTKCSHLNGTYEDTNEFCETVYTSDDGKNYAENYEANDLENFNYRVTSIYMPKAEFLFTSLKNDSVVPNNLSYLDFGSGTGYFASALDKMGLNSVSGSEVSKFQVELGNKMIGKDLLSVHSLSDTEKVLSETKANVVSMIGVLEHLQDPREAIKSIMKNDNISYLYISVPLFSLSVYIEMLSNDIFHRQLHGGHTHLYTEESLNYLAQEFNFDIISEWWFGTDMVDLYRNMFINIEDKNVSSTIKVHYKNMMTKIIDSMQLEIDKNHYSSEVHMLLKKKNNA